MAQTDNTFLTANLIAAKALPVLSNELVMGNLVYRDYSSEFGTHGQSIQVEKPASFTAQSFGTAVSSYQNISPTSVTVSLDKLYSVDVKLTAKQAALNIRDFTQQVSVPAMQALAQQVDSDLVGLYVDVFTQHGTAATTPDGMDDFTGARKELNDEKVPMVGRNMVLGSAADEKLLQLDAIVRADQSGSTRALREASIGRIMGFDTYLDQNIGSHTAGTFSSGNGTTTLASSSLSLTGGTSGQTFTAGDLITLAGDSQSYVVTAAATVTGTTATLAISPAAKVAVTAGAITLAATHVYNLGFHQQAFALVNRPLAAPMGGAIAAQASYGGLSIQVVMDYDMDGKQNVISYNYLYGCKTLYPELAVRLLG